MLEDNIKEISSLFRSFPFIEKISIERENIMNVTIKSLTRKFTSNESVELLEWCESYLEEK